MVRYLSNARGAIERMGGFDGEVVSKGGASMDTGYRGC